MLSPENLADLAEHALEGPAAERPDAMFALIKELAGPEPPADAPLEQKQRYDLAYAALDRVFPRTARYQLAFRAELDPAAIASEMMT